MFHEIHFPIRLLNANDPLFKRIGALFINEMTKAWGSDHIYNCDTFNENKPPSSDPVCLRSRRLCATVCLMVDCVQAYLAASSAAVYSSMTSADKDAIWLMQGWLFVDDPDFWKPAQVCRALCSRSACFLSCSLFI